MNDVSVESYKPSDNEPFMNDRQREYFRRKLIAWRESILAESRDTLAALQQESENHPDFADRDGFRFPAEAPPAYRGSRPELTRARRSACGGNILVVGRS